MQWNHHCIHCPCACFDQRLSAHLQVRSRGQQAPVRAKVTTVSRHSNEHTVKQSCMTTCARSVCGSLARNLCVGIFASGSCRTSCARSLDEDPCCKISLSGCLHQDPVGPLVQDLFMGFLAQGQDLLSRILEKHSSAESCRSTGARLVYEELLCKMFVSRPPRILQEHLCKIFVVTACDVSSPPHCQKTLKFSRLPQIPVV